MKDSLSDLIEAARDHRLVIFCGAGISMLPPSRSPSWWEIYQEVARALAERLRDGFGETLPAVDVDALLAPMATQQLADLVVSRFAGETFSELLTVVDVADPNSNHRALATLAAAGAVRAILTTNFDTLIERASAARGIRMATTVPGIAARPEPGDACALIKIHGTTVAPISMIETSTQKGREVAESLREAWLPALPGAALLVLGYSGADLNFGAAKAFFEDVLALDLPIYWAHRPGSKPKLDPRVEARTILLEGGLPFPVHNICDSLGLADFDIPLTGRDAQARLANSARAWSSRGHIGRWAAATFFFLLCKRTIGFEALTGALREIAREQAGKLKPGEHFSADDLALGIFLQNTGLHALEALAVDEARMMLEASLRMQASLDYHLHDPSDEGRRERLSNMAGGWNNLAFCSLLDGNIATALAHFHSALDHAYEGGHVQASLIAIGNILAFGDELKTVRRSMRLAGAAVELADRAGAVETSINMRILLALYAFNRNEVWLADDWLAEAQRRARALSLDRAVAETEILMGESDIRKGRIGAGLARIAAALSARPHQVFLSRALEETRCYLAVLGIPSSGPFMLKLEPSDVAGHVGRIEGIRRAAAESGTPPWQGAHVAVSRSATVANDDLYALAQLGFLTFDGETESAAQLGLRIANAMLARGCIAEARWAVGNALGAATDGEARAHAVGVLAGIDAEIGRLPETRWLFDEAAQTHAKEKLPVPAGLASAALWFFVQSKEADEAIRWVRKWKENLTADPRQANEFYAEAMRVDSWGAAMSHVASALRDALAPLGVTVPRGQWAEPTPYRRYVGASAPVASDQWTAAEQIAQARSALSAGNLADVARLLETVMAVPGLPEQQLAAAGELTLQALWSNQPMEKVETAAGAIRARFLEELAFTALARLETLLWRMRVSAGQVDRAMEALQRIDWAADLATPAARAALLACLAPFSIGGKAARIREAVATAHYFGIATVGADIEPRVRSAQQEQAADTMTAAARELRAAATSSDADAVVRETIRTMRTTGQLTSEQLATLRGNRAIWALNGKRFKEATHHFRRAERAFRRLGYLDAALNAVAGAARAASRHGDYEDAKALFVSALSEVGAGGKRSDLLRGLGAAQLLEATERRTPIDLSLLDEAIGTLSDAVSAAQVDSADRAFARLAWARALGERGDQDAALESLDTAISELAHLGSAEAKLLIEHRDQFLDGHWRGLQLG